VIGGQKAHDFCNDRIAAPLNQQSVINRQGNKNNTPKYMPKDRHKGKEIKQPKAKSNHIRRDGSGAKGVMGTSRSG
jgi:hypothetical protein